MKRVLLITPSSNTFYTLAAPLGQAYVAAELEDYVVYGIDINVYRYELNMKTAKIYEVIEKIIEVYEIQYVGISILEETWKEAIELAQICKKWGCIVWAGGIMPTMFPDDIPFVFDYILRGDTEKEVGKLLRRLDDNQDIDDIAGISYQKENRWEHNGLAVEPNCKNGVMPKREIFEKFHFGYKYSTARMITSRGCIYRCSFCTNRRIKSNFCRRHTEDIVNEISMLIEKENIKQIIFSDDQFLGTNKEEYEEAYYIVKSIKDKLMKENVRLNFQVRADHLLRCKEKKPELFEMLTEISLSYKDENFEAHKRIYGRAMRGVGIDIGIEAFSDSTLKYFQKDVTSKMNIECLNTLKNSKIDVGVYMILYTPVVKIEEIIYELQCYYKYYIKNGYESILLFSNLFKPLVPYKGTKIYDELLQNNKLIYEHYYNFEDDRVALFYIFMENELIRICERVKNVDEMYEVILNVALYCKDIKIENNSILKRVICDYDNSKLVERIYNQYFS